MPLPAIAVGASIWGVVTTAATYLVKLAKDHFFTLGLSVAMGATVFTLFDNAINLLLDEIIGASSDIPERALQMMGILGLDEAIRIVFSAATAAYAFVVTSGASSIIRRKRWERARLMKDREMIEGTADIIGSSKGSVTYGTKSTTYSEYLEEFIR